MKVDLAPIVLNEKATVKITLENLDDFWTAANIIHCGDHLHAVIRRKVTAPSQTGVNTESHIITAKAWISITEVDYQPGVAEMRVRGTLCHEIHDCRKGSFQRVLLVIGHQFELSKMCWDRFSYEELEQAANPIADASVAAILLQSGLSNLCIIGRNSTVIVASVQKSLPKVKAYGSNGRNQEAKQKFYQMTAEAMLDHIPLNDMRCVIVASPGFYASEFIAFLRDRQSQLGIQNDLRANKFVQGTVPDAQPESIDILLSRPDMAGHVRELKAVVQARAMEELEKAMNVNMDTVALGEKEVFDRLKNDNVLKLVVNDQWIREQPFQKRQRFMEFREALGDAAVVFSVRHPSGEKLKGYGDGIAAICKYAVPRDEGDDGFDDAF
jgi:protein pelota